MDAYITIPDVITVHLGMPNQYAKNVTLPFSDYIKNVASSEIYPTWPEEAIRANVLAQVSYALNRVYTEWYRSQGFPFDITNTTQYDQAFVDGRNIFENISTIVDELFTSYIVRGDSVVPLFAQYCNGTTSLCAGLSQWGTVDLAEQGYTYFEILQYYYGDDIRIIRDAPIAANIPSWSGTVYREGDLGNAIQLLQLRLNRISRNYPAIPKIPVTHGFFDAATRAAVEKFQSIFNLTVDGLVGQSTWYRIQYIYNSVMRLSELESETVLLSDLSREFQGYLQEGDNSRDVEILKYFLSIVGTYYEAVPIISAINTIFDAETTQVVMAFQQYKGLTVTGILDEDTWFTIGNSLRAILRARPVEEWLPDLVDYEPLYISEGMRGENVLEAQRILNILARAYPEIPTVTEDGIFGAGTRDAVAIAQSVFEHPATGIIGPFTWNRFLQEASVIERGSQVQDGQYPGYVITEEVAG